MWNGYCPEPGGDPFTFNQSTQFAYYFVFSAYDCGGVYLEAGEDWIGVYNGDVCVGGSVWPGGPVDIPAYGDDGEDYSAGYLNSGDIPTYKIYDASEDMYYDATPNANFPFEHLGFNNIYRMDAGISQDIVLEEGANLVSFYILPEDNSVENIMATLDGNISAVLSGGSAAQYLDGWGWIGSLLSIEYDEGYWLIMSGDDQLEIVDGTPIDPDTEYALSQGDNLIGYPLNENTVLIDALGGKMGLLADYAGIQFKMLNRSKGKAVWSPRAQIDKKEYEKLVQEIVFKQAGLSIIESEARKIICSGESVVGLEIDGSVKIKGLPISIGPQPFASSTVIIYSP